MKVLVVENRMATRVFECLTQNLDQETEVKWLIFNKQFAPGFSSGENFFIKHHGKTVRNQTKNKKYKCISRSEIYFDIKIDYGFYIEQLKILLDIYRPDLVIGETTQFYELLLVELCLEQGIPYLNPVSTRYPVGRFEFLLYDTDFPLKIRPRMKMPVDQYFETMVKDIRSSKLKPSYTIQDKISTFKKYWTRLVYAKKILSTRLFYETKITPSFTKKLFLTVETMIRARRLEQIAYRNLDQMPEKFVLYPMQVQPEVTIDIWGKKNRNQSVLIKELAVALEPFNIGVCVKPNPISKYQMTEELLKVICETSNVFYVAKNIQMKDLLDLCGSVVVNVGSVIFEALALNKPVFVLYDGRLSEIDGVIKIQKPAEISKYVDAIGKKNIDTGGLVGSLKDIYSNSLPGEIFDPISRPQLLSNSANAENLATGFKFIIDNFDQCDFEYAREKSGTIFS